MGVGECTTQVPHAAHVKGWQKLCARAGSRRRPCKLPVKGWVVFDATQRNAFMKDLQTKLVKDYSLRMQFSDIASSMGMATSPT